MPERQYFDSQVPTQTFRKNDIVPNADGSFAVKGVKIFRTGKFRDSKGRKHDIGTADLDAMVSNFHKLRAEQKFVDVPVRKDHSSTIEKVMGYFSDLRRSGRFLEADFDSVAPEDLNKLAMGLFRNVSAEIGAFPDNDDNVHFPTVMGVAYVDIPAVSGLFNACLDGETAFTFSGNPQDSDDFTGNRLEISENAGEIVADAVASHSEIALFTRHDSGDETVPNENEPKTYTFKLGGQETTDFAAVQAHITKLETDNAALTEQAEEHAKFMMEQAEASRIEFVAQLVKDEKVPAGMKDGLEATVKTMDDAQFAAFSAVYADAPKLTTFESHGEGGGNSGKSANDDSDAEKRIAQYRRRVQHHVDSGAFSKEKLRETESFRTLVSLVGGEDKIGVDLGRLK